LGELLLLLVFASGRLLLACLQSYWLEESDQIQKYHSRCRVMRVQQEEEGRNPGKERTTVVEYQILCRNSAKYVADPYTGNSSDVCQQEDR